jgi:hypothetical protein
MSVGRGAAAATAMRRLDSLCVFLEQDFVLLTEEFVENG